MDAKIFRSLKFVRLGLCSPLGLRESRSSRRVLGLMLGLNKVLDLPDLLGLPG